MSLLSFAIMPEVVNRMYESLRKHWTSDLSRMKVCQAGSQRGGRLEGSKDPTRDGGLEVRPLEAGLHLEAGLGLGLGCPCLGLGLGGPGFVYRVLRTGIGLEAGLET